MTAFYTGPPGLASCVKTTYFMTIERLASNNGFLDMYYGVYVDITWEIVA
jgi:hypothetical protein